MNHTASTFVVKGGKDTTTLRYHAEILHSLKYVSVSVKRISMLDFSFPRYDNQLWKIHDEADYYPMEKVILSPQFLDV